MISKKKLLHRSLLCVIIDKGYCDDARARSVARKAAAAGADMIQLRGKRAETAALIRTAKFIKRIAGRYRIPLVVNDRIDVALASGADGVHLGCGDISAEAARTLLGRNAIIGISAATIEQARRAVRQGASYIGAGPVFQTPVKKNKRASGVRFLRRVRRFNVPVVAIGGINGENIYRLTELGFNKVAVIRAVMNSRDPFGAARRLKEALT